MRDSDINIEIDKITVSNIVLTDEIDFHSSLDVAISSQIPIILLMNLNNFQGYFIKMSMELIIPFTSGKIIMTGVKNLDVAKKNLKKFKELIEISNDSTR